MKLPDQSQKVLSVAPNFESTQEIFDGIAHLVSYWNTKPFSFTSEELTRMIPGFDACVVWLDNLDSRAIHAGRQLKVIGIPRAGFDNVDVQTATDLGIPVVYAPGANSTAVADFTMGAIITLTRSISFAAISMKSGI